MKAKANDGKPDKKREKSPKGSGVDPSRMPNKKKSDETKKSGGRRSGGGGVGGGRDGSINPLIHVTRASDGVEDSAPPDHTPDKRLTVDEAKTPTVTAEESKAEKTDEAPGLDAHAAPTDAAHSTTSLDRQHKSRPLFPGVIVIVIGLVLFSLGIVFVAFIYMVIGCCFIIFGAILLLCGFIYLIHCFVEKFMAKRQRNFREAALGRGSTWLTKPSPNRRSVLSRNLKRSSSTDIS